MALYSSDNNNITLNNISINDGVGIFLHASSKNNYFSYNNISENNQGIRFDGGSINNIIFCNNISNNDASINILDIAYFKPEWNWMFEISSFESQI